MQMISTKGSSNKVGWVGGVGGVGGWGGWVGGWVAARHGLELSIVPF